MGNPRALIGPQQGFRFLRRPGQNGFISVRECPIGLRQIGGGAHRFLDFGGCLGAVEAGGGLGKRTHGNYTRQ